MNAYQKKQSSADVVAAAQRHGITLAFMDARALRLAEIRLHDWAELECGTCDRVSSWAIERDDDDGRPYLYTYPNKGGMYRRAVIDDERAALRRVAEICTRLGLYYYHQPDPRGCALYVDREPIPDNDYTRAVACIGRYP